ncbi:sphingosine 1-phosphate receptor 3 isoform 3-T4 [Ara ararauna]
MWWPPRAGRSRQGRSRAWFGSQSPKLICEGGWSWGSTPPAKSAWRSVAWSPSCGKLSKLSSCDAKEEKSSMVKQMMAAVTEPADALVSPQGNEEMDSLIVLHYNYTGKLILREKATDNIDLPTVAFLILCSFIVLENLMVLIAIWKNNKFHNRMYFFIGNLALCDLLAGVVYKVNILMSGKKTLSLSSTIWFIREGSMFVALGASTFSLLAIAIERHLTMIKMRPYDANKKYRVFLLIGTCWLISVSLGALPILGWNCINNLPDCSTILPLYSKKYVVFCISIFIAILVAIVILYARIYILVKSSSRNVTNHNNSERSMALLRTVVIVVSVFIACWSPLFILFLIDVACKVRECSILYKANWFIALAVINSAMNPIIYTLASKEMRRAFFRLVCGCLVKSKVSRSLPVPPTPDHSRSKSSSSNAQKPREDFPPNKIPSCIAEKNEFSFHNGNICK